MYGWLSEACDGNSQIVTASRRLARVLSAEYNAAQAGRGKRAWLTPVILSYPDWLSSLLATADPAEQPVRIGSHQSRVLWEQILRGLIDDALINVPSLTRHTRDAWQRLHEWQVPFEECVSAASSRDQRIFAAAATKYRERLAAEGWIDEALLAGHVIAAVRAGNLSAPKKITLAGFDRLTPQIEALLDAVREGGTLVQSAGSRMAGSDARVVACADPDAELRVAGRWARERLEEDPGQRIGIVVSNLEQDAERAGRLVREGLVPGWQFASGPQGDAVNVSFGRRLHDYPAVDIALLLLRWGCGTIGGSDLSLLLRTPFLGSKDMDARARLELRLRRLPDRSWTPEMLLRSFDLGKEADGGSDWLRRLAGLVDFHRAQPRSASPAYWAGAIDALLDGFGWPGGGALSSGDFQLVNRWRDLLNDFAKLEVVMPKMSLAQAVGQLRAMATDTTFQPETEDAVVHVLGTLEAAGIEFDRLWIAGLTASRWPPSARPTALISRRLQRHYAMPDAEPDDTAAYAKRVIDRLLRSAPSCTCSFPQQSGDSIETQTALLGDTPAGDAMEDPGWHAALLCDRAMANTVEYDPVPPLAADETVSGGSATIQLQMSEPFAAFAQGRLGISPLRPILPGLSPLLRGNLIHAAMFHLYEELPSQADVRRWQGTELDERIAAATKRAFARYERHADDMLRELLGLERQRVARLLHDVVAVDLRREAFSVHGVELELETSLAGIPLGLRIDRIDRFDDGAMGILDYKTGGRKKFLDGAGEPTDAQLLIYAMALAEPVASLGFYNVDTRETGIDGSGRDLTGADEWAEALARWTGRVEQSAREFAAGDVRIRYWQTLAEARPLNLLSRFGELRRDA